MASWERKKIERQQLRHFVVAINNRDNSHMTELLKDTNIDINGLYNRQSLLELAVVSGNAEACRLLIKHGADIQHVTSDYSSLLTISVRMHHSEVVQVLLEPDGMELDYHNADGDTALNIASSLGFTDLVALLIEKQCNLNFQNTADRTPFYSACLNGHLDCVKQLSAAGADVNMAAKDKKTALITVAESEALDVVKTLLECSKIDLCACDRHGCSALWYAAQRGNIKIVELLIQHKADVNKYDNRGTTPLLEATRNNHPEVVRILADAGADINKADFNYLYAPIHIAIRHSTRLYGEHQSSPVLLDLLLELNCNLYPHDGTGWTPMHQAAFCGDIEIMKKLLAKSRDWNQFVVSRCQLQSTCLHVAVMSQKKGAVQLMLDIGCDINAVNSQNRTPLLIAVDNKVKIEVIQLLVSAGSDLEICDSEKQETALCFAVRHDLVDALLVLIMAGANVNHMNKDGDTPLWIACEKNNLQVINALLECPQTDLDKGLAHIPLHTAVINGCVATVVKLLSKGASVNKLSDICSSALYFAADFNRHDIAKLLIYYGADSEYFHRVPVPQKCCHMYRDRHPHFELEPLQCAIRQNNFKMLKILLLGTSDMPYHVVSTLKDILFRTSYIRDTSMSTQLVQQYAAFFNIILRKPRPLQQSCRGVIRQSLGERPFTKVSRLPVPKKIQQYLLFKTDLLEDFDVDAFMKPYL